MDYISRRAFLQIAASTALSGHLLPARASGQWVNDIHSGLNRTRVSQVLKVSTAQELQNLVRRTAARKGALAVCGARHAGGGQQFLTDHLLVDCTPMQRVLNFDEEKGLLKVEPGIRWSGILQFLHDGALDNRMWCVRQRPTGNDRLSLGGTLSANAHGQGLNFPPLIDDIEELELIDGTGKLLTVNRSQNAELFSLVVGGYGMFALVAAVTLRLIPLQKLRCLASETSVRDLEGWHAASIKEGAIYGSMQVNVDDKSPDFLRAGICNKYLPVSDAEPVTRHHRVSSQDWLNLVTLAHTNMTAAWETFARLQLDSSGEVDWSYRWHTSPYVEGYHHRLDIQAHRLDARAHQHQAHQHQDGSEILTELYVPLAALPAFMENVRQYVLASGTRIFYSTVRFIDRDNQSFLPWARQHYACVIFNLHAVHSPAELSQCATALRKLIDIAIKYDGSYYLTYHRFADRSQLLSCYPQFPDFLAKKLQYDPAEVFQSDWYRHYKSLFT